MPDNTAERSYWKIVPPKLQWHKESKYVECVVECCSLLLCSGEMRAMMKKIIFNLTCLILSVSQFFFAWCTTGVTVLVNPSICTVMIQYILCNGLHFHSESFMNKILVEQDTDRKRT